MTIHVKEIIKILAKIIPHQFALPNDPIGLQSGDKNCHVKKIMLCLDATSDVLKEANAKKVQMLISHHPRFYKPLKNLDTSNYYANLGVEVAKSNLTIFSAHTNLDIMPNGINDLLAEIAGLKKHQPLTNNITEQMLKVVVFIPESHVEKVTKAICSAGAGEIGEYSDCSFRTLGTGEFYAKSTSQPFVGQKNSHTQVTEWKVEAILGEFAKSKVEQAIYDSHPYEQPAYDFIKLDQYNYYGLGRYGDLQEPVTLSYLLKLFQKNTHSTMIQYLGKTDDVVKSLAVWSGSSVDLAALIFSKVDCLITGEISFHEYEYLKKYNIKLITLGHYFSEAIILPKIANVLQNKFKDIEILISQEELPQLINFF